MKLRRQRPAEHFVADVHMILYPAQGTKVFYFRYSLEVHPLFPQKEYLKYILCSEGLGKSGIWV